MDIIQKICTSYSSHDTKLFYELIDLIPDIDAKKLINHNCTVIRLQTMISQNIKIKFDDYMLHAITHDNVDVVRFLLENKYIDPNHHIQYEHTRQRESWLHIAIHVIYFGHDGEPVDINHQLDIIKLFVQHGSDIYANESSHNIMRYAMGEIPVYDNEPACGSVRNIQMLIEYLVTIGLSPNTVDSNSRTPLCHALGFFYCYDHIKFLLEHGADANAMFPDDCTLLMYIVQLSSKELSNVKAIVLLLLEHGADPNLRNRKGQNAMSVARDDLKGFIQEWMDVPVKGVMNG